MGRRALSRGTDRVLEQGREVVGVRRARDRGVALPEPEAFHHGVVEALGPLEIRHGDVEVIEPYG
jgi:hypothetical protein